MSSLVTKSAPDFTAQAVMGNNAFEDLTLSSYKGKYVVLFFYPLDFTFVCPSEIIAHDKRLAEFKKRGAEVIGVSIDSHFTHLAWRNTAINDGGIGPVQFPMVADMNHSITQSFGVEHPDGVALRASFLIDRDGVVQHQTVNNLPLGRNVDEMLRMLDALKFSEEHGEVCPAGWQQGEAGMKASTEGVKEYLATHANEL